MARETVTEITCDADGCRKQPGSASNDHIEISAAHHVLVPAVDGGEVPYVASASTYDYCSWDHALKDLRARGKDSESAREEMVETAKQQITEARAAEEATAADDEPEDDEGS